MLLLQWPALQQATVTNRQHVRWSWLSSETQPRQQSHQLHCWQWLPSTCWSAGSVSWHLCVSLLHGNGDNHWKLIRYLWWSSYKLPLWPHHPQFTKWRSSPLSRISNPKAFLGLEATERKTQPYLAMCNWCLFEATEYWNLVCMEEDY